MGIKAAAGERYTIRRQFIKLFGAGFDLYDAEGKPIGYCKQKAFRFKEDFRVFTDRSQSQELFRIAARQIIDFSATYDVKLPTGEVLGSLRRKGMKSIIRDEWLVFDAEGNEIGLLQEDSGSLAIIRRVIDWASVLFPQRFQLKLKDGTPIAGYRQHFNPFIYRLGVTVLTDHDTVDDLLVLATGVLIAAIEGRQG